MAMCYQLILIIAGLILPRCFLHYYGSEVNGLISSITQFLALINICDLGIGAVVSAAYYKPLADGDIYQVSKIFIYSKHFFKKVGFILIAYIVILLGIYPTLINNSIDFWFTFTLIAAMSLSQLGQYLIGISYQLLLNSDQKSYVQLIFNGITLLLNTIISIMLMVRGASIQLVKLTTSLIYLSRPIAMSIYVKKNYSIDYSVTIDSSVIPQKKNGIVQHMAYMIYENTDVMVLTFFSTLQNVSVYAVYTLATNSIKQIISAMTTGVQSLLGNMIAKNETERLKKFYLFYNWSFHTVSTVLYTIAGLLILPFVKIYTAGVTDTNYYVPLFAILITIAYFFSSVRNCQYILIRAAGHFKQTQFASLFEALLNLLISIVFVFKFGLVGVALGTIIATVFFVIYEILYFSRNIIFISIFYFLKQFLADAIIVAVSCLIATRINFFNNSILSWLLQAIVVSLIVLGICIIIQLVFYRRNLVIMSNKFLVKFMKQ